MEIVNNIETVEECNALETVLNDDESQVRTEVAVLEQKLKTINESGKEVKANFQKSQAKLQAINSLVTGLADPELKEEYDEEILALDLRVVRLTKRLRNTGMVARVEVEFDLKIKRMILVEIAALKTEVLARKAALSA